ncbi:hypothetical protein HDU82_003950, partial [Entophlyctis luteolus]
MRSDSDPDSIDVRSLQVPLKLVKPAVSLGRLRILFAPGSREAAASATISTSGVARRRSAAPRSASIEQSPWRSSSKHSDFLSYSGPPEAALALAPPADRSFDSPRTTPVALSRASSASSGNDLQIQRSLTLQPRPRRNPVASAVGDGDAKHSDIKFIALPVFPSGYKERR